MFEVSVKAHFSAAHHLKGYRGSCEALHGHNWDVEVHARGTELDETGLLMDFRDLKSAVKKVLDELDHTDLNVHPVFRDANPSSENIARYLHEQLSGLANTDQCRVYKVSVDETRGARASYWVE